MGMVLLHIFQDAQQGAGASEALANDLIDESLVFSGNGGKR